MKIHRQHLQSVPHKENCCPLTFLSWATGMPVTFASWQIASAKRLGKPCLCSTACTPAAPPWDPCSTCCQHSTLWPVQFIFRTAASSIYIQGVMHRAGFPIYMVAQTLRCSAQMNMLHHRSLYARPERVSSQQQQHQHEHESKQ